MTQTAPQILIFTADSNLSKQISEAVEQTKKYVPVVLTDTDSMNLNLANTVLALLPLSLGDENCKKTIADLSSLKVRPLVFVVDDLGGQKPIPLGCDECIQLSDLNGALISALVRYHLERQVYGETIGRRQKEISRDLHLASFGELAGSMAHEINNPLMVLASYIEKLKVAHSLGHSKKQAYEIKEIIQRADRLIGKITTIVHGLRRLLRRPADDPFELTSTQTILTDAYEFCGIKVGESGIQLILPEVSPKMELECRGTQVAQGLTNLMLNSIDAAMESKVPWVKVDVKDLGEFVEFSVTDSGTSVPADLQSVFKQAFVTTKDPGKSMGLGLSLADRIAEAHQGRLFIDEQSPNTRFVMQLPKRHQPDTQNKLSILVVDDDPGILELIAEEFGGRGCRTDTALEAEQALQMIQQRQYDAVVTDIYMPGQSGIELYQQLAKQAHRPSVFFITGYLPSSFQDYESIMKEPIFQKPFNTHDLANKVIQYVKLKQTSTSPTH